MEQHKRCKNKNGFTTIELMVVVAILVFLIAGALVSMGAVHKRIKKVAFEEVKENVVQAIEKARNRAATGFGLHGHGVCVKDGDLIIYEENCDSTYASNARVYLPASVVNPDDFPVKFERITAKTDVKDIIVSYGGQTSTIRIGPDGTIY